MFWINQKPFSRSTFYQTSSIWIKALYDLSSKQLEIWSLAADRHVSELKMSKNSFSNATLEFPQGSIIGTASCHMYDFLHCVFNESAYNTADTSKLLLFLKKFIEKLKLIICNSSIEQNEKNKQNQVIIR